MRTMDVVNPGVMVRCSRKRNSVRMSVNERRDFVVVMSILGMVDVLERPHDKCQKKGQASLQSSKTTNHHRIMPYSRVGFNQAPLMNLLLTLRETIFFLASL